jgi:hypothetical protein
MVKWNSRKASRTRACLKFELSQPSPRNKSRSVVWGLVMLSGIRRASAMRVGNRDHARLPPRQFTWKNSRIRFSPSRGRSRPSIASLLRSGWLHADRIVSSMSHRSADAVRILLSRWVLSLLDTIAALAAGSPPAASFLRSVLRSGFRVERRLDSFPRYDMLGRDRAALRACERLQVHFSPSLIRSRPSFASSCH